MYYKDYGYVLVVKTFEIRIRLTSKSVNKGC